MWISVKPGQLALAQRVLDELVRRGRVRALLLLRDRERAELALHAADVRLVQVEVLDEEDLVGAAADAPRACRPARRAARRSSDSISVRPSSKSSRSLASTFSRIAVERRCCARRSPRHQPSRSTTRWVRASREARSGSPSSAARARAAYSSASSRAASSAPVAATQLERAVDRLARKRPPDALVLARGEDERQRRRAVAQVDARAPCRSCRSRRCSRGCRRRSGRRRRARARRPRARAGRRRAGRRPRRACPVLSEQRARYSSTVVSGPERLPALERLAARERERRARRGRPRPSASPVAASSANARAKR